MTGKKLLIVDDEVDIVEMLAYNFIQEGAQVFKAYNGKDAIETAKSVIPQLIILDLMLPDVDGIEVCERIRQIPALNKTIIVFLSARGEDYSQVAGYQAGADDYIVKPIRPKVLKHKLHALLERAASTNTSLKNGLTVNPERFSITQNGVEIVIPKKEFELLSLLMSIPEKVFRREEIMRNVWGDSYIGDRTIDVHIRKLREKFGKGVIETVKGVGYRYIG